jgi:hypothetical protein
VPLRGAMPGMKLGAGWALRVAAVVLGAVAGVEGACWGWRAVRRHRVTLDRSEAVTECGAGISVAGHARCCCERVCQSPD